MGHIRDLPQSATEIPASLKGEEWAKLGVNVEQNFEPLYVIPKGKSKVVSELKKKLKEAQGLFLATDEDREGESISWHLVEILKPKVPVKRMVFHEITKKAIEEALKKTRSIDMRMVEAQEARRILDRIYGYSLSPLLWKKISFGLSAGRVQSSGLRLIVERERERMRFKKSEYWDLKAQLEAQTKKFEAKLISLKGTRIAQGRDFDPTTGELKGEKGTLPKVLGPTDAKALAQALANTDFIVADIQDREATVRPQAPFITSSLQQEGNRKLGWSARVTMRVAQTLYEKGLITYMRTDSPSLSQEAIKAARDQVQELFGKNFLSPEPRQYQAKSKGAQEAHEAIRPAGSEFAHPESLDLDHDERKLYELIWKRTLATQMAEAKKSHQTVSIKANDAHFQANGTRIVFPGFIRVYVEGSDDPEAAMEDKEVILPELKIGQKLKTLDLAPMSHETRPPARFTEASLIQRLENEGIGRPSTYATIIGTIQERGYVRKESNALIPTFTGMAVIQLLEKHFADLVDYKFTSGMEETLDSIASGEKATTEYLKGFYHGKNGLKAKIKENEKKIKPEESRTIFLEGKNLEVKVGRYGPYIIRGEGENEVHASLPEEIAPADLSAEMVDALIEQNAGGPKAIGKDPKTDQNIYCLVGRYGAYVQLGEKVEDGPAPRRASLPKDITPQTITLEQALRLLILPRELGLHPEKKKAVMANQGRFGPYVSCDGEYRSIKKDDDVYSISLTRAVELLSQEKVASRGSVVLRDFGAHPETKSKVTLYKGKYGPYIKYGTQNVGLPQELKEKLTADEAHAKELKLQDILPLLGEAKGGKAPKGKSRRAAKS